MFLARKSMPTVGWVRSWYIGSFLEAVVDILLDDAGFSYWLSSQEDHLYLGLPRYSAAYRMVHNSNISLYLLSKCTVRTTPKRITTQPAWNRLSIVLLPVPCCSSTSLSRVCGCSCRTLGIYNCFCGSSCLCPGSSDLLCQSQYFFDRNILPLLVFSGRTFTSGPEKRRMFCHLDPIWILTSFWHESLSMDLNYLLPRFTILLWVLPKPRE